MEQRPLRRHRRRFVTVAGIVLLAATAAGVTLWTRGHSVRREAASGAVLHPPRADTEGVGGQRVRVEVLNATPVRGLARRATRLLRDRGFDVVELGTAREHRDTTLVIDRAGRPAWSQLVARAMGGATRVEVRPDSLRYVDITVLIGASWRPPPQPFYP